ncbi:MAG: acyl carrier protein [Alphaproteobacteria bacterium]|mgnify:CR=1 FL=1|jgi:acyl carrier protein|nr:acyl carrier protein [Alphaproteobacteria bacterium]MDP6518109.1 acyl carrier protein [Alphaproteobacteria bacterium]
MTRNEIDRALREIFADIFDQAPESFDYETNPDTLLNWDSLAHLRLIAALEERFAITISPEDQVDMLSFELMGDLLAELTEV